MFKFVPKDQNILQIHFDIFKNIFLAEGHTIDGEWLLPQQLTHTHTVSHYGHSSLTMFTAEWPNILVIHVKQVLQKKTNSKSYVESLSIVSAKAGMTKELAHTFPFLHCSSSGFVWWQFIYVQLEWPKNLVSGSTQQHTSCRPKQIFVLALCLFSTCNVSCPNICICKQQEGQHLDKNSHFLRLHVTENVRAVKSTNCQAANKCRSGVYKPSKSSYREAKLFFTCMC